MAKFLLLHGSLALVGTPVLFALFFGGLAALLHFEFALTNRTQYAEGFSWSRWSEVQPSWSREQVIRKVDQPIKPSPWSVYSCSTVGPDCGKELWAVPIDGYAYYAQIEFGDDKVVGKKYWEDD